MRIGILSTGQVGEDERLVSVSKARGHEVDVLNLLDCSLYGSLDKPKIFYKKKDISNCYDMVIPRIDVSYTDYGFAILRQFQALDIYVTDTAHSIELGRDKLRCMQYLMRHKVPFPQTGLADSPETMRHILEQMGGAPFIVKLIEGTQGCGVFLVNNLKEAENIIGTLRAFNAPVLIQKFIAESAGVDLRCFVVGDKVVASVRRESQDGDFRANIGLGGCAYAEEISKEEEEIVLRATKAIGLNIAGVDLIRSNEGPLILEINASPDFVGERRMDVTGIDVGAAIIDYALTQKELFDAGQGRWLR